MVETSKARVLRLYQAGNSVAAVARLMGVQTQYVSKILTGAGITRARARTGPARLEELQDFGPLHRQIGNRLRQAYRVDRDLRVSEIATLLGMSCTNVTNSGDAAYDFRLSELRRIAEYLGVPLPELVTETSVKFGDIPK